MKIGIGCITYNRPLHLQHWFNSIGEFSNDDSTVVIGDDNFERKGVSFRSNECLKKLYELGCDYFFIFNDDCFPIKKGWEKFFIDASEQSQQKHFQFMRHGADNHVLATVTDPEIPDFKKINIFENTNGCMMFMTRECIDKIGGFNPEYFYGFEHANYSDRINKAGLTPHGKYSCPDGADKYIYSLDLEPESELHRKLRHKPSMRSIESIMKVREALPIYQNDSLLYYPL